MPVAFKVLPKGLVRSWWFEANGELSFMIPLGHGNTTNQPVGAASKQRVEPFQVCHENHTFSSVMLCTYVYNSQPL